MRKVTIYSTTGKSSYVIDSEAAIWSDLQRDLSRNGISYSGMKVIIGDTRLVVESPNSTLPDSDFTLFLMPVKTKSGADRKAIMEQIKAIIARDPGAKSHFSEGKLNMTQLSTDKLVRMLEVYGVNVPAANTTAAPTVAAVVVSIKEAEITVENLKEEIDDKIDVLMADYDIDEDDDALKNLIVAIDNLAKFAVKADTRNVEPAKSVETEAQRRNRELAAAAENLAKDFKDVNCC